MQRVRVVTLPLTTLERTLPGPFLFIYDVLRLAFCLALPILTYFVGERLACLYRGEFAHEILGFTLILDFALTVFVLLPRVKRWGYRPLRWCISDEPGFTGYSNTDN